MPVPASRQRRSSEKSPIWREHGSVSTSEDSEDSKEEGKFPPETPVKEQRENRSLLYSCVILVLIVLLCLKFWSEAKNPENLIDQEILQAIKNIGSKFPTQESDLWVKFYSVLSTVSNSNTVCPGVILLLHRDKQSEVTSKCIVAMVANQSASLLPFKEHKPLFLSSSDLSCSGCIEKKKSEVKDHGTVVIHNLEKFSIESAKALHFFCDENDCNFPKAAYILTMTVTNMEKNPTRAAELAFKLYWASMAENQLSPLITRLTGQANFVKPEKSLDCDL